MRRDTLSLSNTELFSKTRDLIEYATNSKITLQYMKGSNWCRFTGYEKEKLKLFTINVATPPEKNIPRYTGLLHELAHVLYESPFTPIKKLLEKWGRLNYQKAHYMQVFNILEDQRIESHLTKSYLGYQRKFEQTRTGLGKDLQYDMNSLNDPLFILLAIRFFRDDLVKNSPNYDIYKDAIENVAGTDKFGALRVLISIKKYLDEYLSGNDSAALPNCPEENIDNHYNVDKNNPRPKILEKTSDEWINPNSSNNETGKKDELSEDCLIPEELTKENYTQKEIEDILKDGAAKGEKQYQDVRNQLFYGFSDDNLPPNVKKIERKPTSYKIDYKIASGMNKIFKLLRMRNKSFIDYSGHEIDVNEYVENVTKGTNINKSYEFIGKSKGVAIVISLDGSGSMNNDKIKTARKLVATLFESIKGIPNVELRGNIWASSTDGEIGITEINNIHDVKKLTVDDHYYLTPTHMGLEYSMRMLKKMKGERKLLIMVTDGKPEYMKNGSHVSIVGYKKTCKKSLQKVLNITPNVMCVIITTSDSERVKATNQFRQFINQSHPQARVFLHTKLMKLIEEDDPSQVKNFIIELFGNKRVIAVDNIHNGSEKIVKQFRQFILKNMNTF